MDDIELRLARAEGPAGGVELGLTVDDLATAHARALGAGARLVQPSGTTASYADPDGNVVTLTERRRAVRVAGVDLAGGALAVVVLEDDRVVEAFRCDTFADALLVEAQVVGIATEPSGKDEDRRRTDELSDCAIRDERVIEVHPEVSFRELAHRPLHSKHRLEGLVERRRLLEEAGLDVPASAPRIAEPDLLDAVVAAWSARRYARGEALPLPEGHAERIGAIWR